MPFYTITEPHPTVPQNSYTHSGRGGAGNIFRAPATTPASGVPTLTTTTSRLSTTSSNSSSSRFYSGRGGAGNAHAAAERPVISFDEEYRERSTTSGSGYVGRGGAGNACGAGVRLSARKDSDASSGAGSDTSSVRSGFWARLKGDRH